MTFFFFFIFAPIAQTIRKLKVHLNGNSFCEFCGFPWMGSDWKAIVIEMGDETIHEPNLNIGLVSRSNMKLFIRLLYQFRFYCLIFGWTISKNVSRACMSLSLCDWNIHKWCACMATINKISIEIITAIRRSN